MTFNAVGYVWWGVAAASVVVALHLLAWRRPMPFALPTARFVPPNAARAVARELRLTDVLLLILRVLALLLAALAMAGPQLSSTRSGRAVVVVADRSRGVADIRDVQLRVDSLARAVDRSRIVWFDSAPQAPRDAGDSTMVRSEARGSLPAALVAASREATALSRTVDSVAIVVVSPVVAEEWDASAIAIGEAWGGPLGVVRVPARVAAPSEGAVSLSPPIDAPSPDDAIAAMLEGAGLRGAVRSATGVAGPGDSAFARGGGVVLVWPRGETRDTSVVAVTTVAQGAVGSVRRGDVAERATGGRVIAWDQRGGPLAWEEAIGAGCIRHLAFRPISRGDHPLRPSLLDVARELAVPCSARDWSLVADSVLARLGTTTSLTSSGVRADAQAPRQDVTTRWLLVASLVALALEWWLRRATARAARKESARDDIAGEREVAA